MFGIWRKRSAKGGLVEHDVDIWNGWAKRLIESINGSDRLDIFINGLTVTSQFDGAEYAGYARIADHPGLTTKERRNIRRDYLVVDVEALGQERHHGINCEIEIVRVAAFEVIEKECTGILVLTSSDHAGGSDPAHEWRTANLFMKLYDVDGSLLHTLRQAFGAAQHGNRALELRAFLGSKIQINSAALSEQMNRAIIISKIVIWENWGKARR
jgi:hypothetical protein